MLPRTSLKATIVNSDFGSTVESLLDVIVTEDTFIIEIRENLLRVNREDLIELLKFKYTYEEE